MNIARKPLFGLIALGAALTLPVAFAQDPTATSDPTAQDPTATPQTTAPPEASAPQQLTWADLDVDSNGTLSKDEASSVQSLAQVFDEADADQDGQLTPDEYKAYVAKINGGAADDGSGGGDD